MSKSQRVPEDVIYAVIAFLIVGVVGVAFVWGPVVAARGLAVLVAVHGIGRVVLPDGSVPRVRTPIKDCVAGVSLAIVLWYLSSWGATILVAR